MSICIFFSRTLFFSKIFRLLYSNPPLVPLNAILKNVISGDDSSIKGLMVLLSTISKREKDIALNSLEALLDKRIINKLRNEKYQDIKSSKNLYTAFRILLTIFINPYDLELKKDPKHLYEKTGMFFYQFRKLLLSNK